jgi:peptidyl-prolyl cis-trans isomerase SurA
MTRASVLLFSLFWLLAFFGCGTSNPVVASFDDEKITMTDFEDSYIKNNNGWDSAAVSSLNDREKFLDLMVNYKLKVKDARDRGLEKDSSILKELDTYRVSIAQSYMLENELFEPGARRMYDRKKEEVRASHIFFRLAPHATPADTLKAYEKAMNAVALLAGHPFDSVARALSEDPSVKTNNGDLGFFSGGKMVPEFEDACYSMKPGEYTKVPIRSRYGYHVVKVTGRRMGEGSIRITHIFLPFERSLKDTAAVGDTAWMVYRELKGGADFTEMVKKYSKDNRAAMNNGDLGYYEDDRLPPQISDVLFRLPVDSISEPVRVNYGYHIFKVTDKKPVPTYAEAEKNIKEAYRQARYQQDYADFVRELKARYRVVIDSSAANLLSHSFDTTKTPAYEDWSDTLTPGMLNTVLIRSTGRSLAVQDIVERIKNSNEYNSTILTPANVWKIVDKFAETVALENEALHYADRYPRIAKLLDEYKDGILLYRVEQDEVWKKVVVNDSLLRDYYNSHRESYRWPERVNFAEIYTLTDSAAKAAYRRVRHGEDFTTVAQECTNRQGYRDKKGVWGFQPEPANALSRKAFSMAVDSVTEPFRYETGWSILKVLGRDSARVKTFEEASPEVASNFQEASSKQREQEWLGALKRKYPVRINKEALMLAFKRKRVELQ